MARIISADSINLVYDLQNPKPYLRRADRANVSAVFERLDAAGVVPCLAGEVVNRHVLFGDHKYDDITIIGAVKNPSVGEYEAFLASLQGKGNIHFSGRRFVFYDAGNVRIRDMASVDNLDRRYILVPKKGSVIDLGLVDEAGLGSVVLPRFSQGLNDSVIK